MTPDTERKPEYWPGTNTIKSTDNGFTHGYLGRPHGYVAGLPTIHKAPRRTPKRHPNQTFVLPRKAA